MPERKEYKRPYKPADEKAPLVETSRLTKMLRPPRFFGNKATRSGVEHVKGTAAFLPASEGPYNRWRTHHANTYPHCSVFAARWPRVSGRSPLHRHIGRRLDDIEQPFQNGINNKAPTAEQVPGGGSPLSGEDHTVPATDTQTGASLRSMPAATQGKTAPSANAH